MTNESSNSFRRLIYGLLLGVLVYALFALAADADELLRHLDRVPVIVIIGACGLSSINYGLRFLKWHAYLHLLGIRIGLGHSLLVFLAGLIMAISPGKVGEVIKSVLLKRSRDISIARTAPIVVAERLTDLLGLFVLAGLGIIVFQYGVVAFALTLVGIFILLAVLQSPSLIEALLDLIEKLPFIGRYRSDLDRAYSSTQTLLRWRPLSAATILSAIAWSMEAFAFAWILHHLGVSSPLLFEAFFVFSTSTLLGALSFLPGGLGVTEGSMAGLLVWLELFDNLSPALAATYLIRFTTLWFGVIVGILSFLLYERSQRRLEEDNPPQPTTTADE